VKFDPSNNVLPGNKVEKLSDLANITVNKNAVFGDSSALAPGGVRIGKNLPDGCII
jgi:glycine hydroxymethyltransferase